MLNALRTVLSLNVARVATMRYANMSSRSLATKVPEPTPAADGDIPTSLEHATGPEREELLEAGRFNMETQKGPFGTAESPVVVESINDWRIVGCVGGEGDAAHDVLWFRAEAGKNHVCPDCGQVFTLKQVADH